MDLTELKAHWKLYADFRVIMDEVRKDIKDSDKLHFLADCAKDEAYYRAMDE